MSARPYTLSMLLAASFVAGSSLPANADLVALYQFEEGTGTTAADSSGNGFDGTLTGESWDGSQYNPDAGELPLWTTGNSGGGISMSSDFGASPFGRQYVLVPYDSAFDLAGDFTVCAWCLYDSDGQGDFLNQGTSPYPTWLFRFDSYFFQWGNLGDTSFYAWDALAGGFQNAFSAGDAAVDSWQHVAYVYSGGSVSLYIDGVLQDTQATTDPTANTADLIIGGNFFSSKNNWNGVLDDVAIFNEALDSTQLAAVISGDFSEFTGTGDGDGDGGPMIPPGAPVGGALGLAALATALAAGGALTYRRKKS